MKGQRANGTEQRAKGKGQRAKGKGQSKSYCLTEIYYLVN